MLLGLYIIIALAFVSQRSHDTEVILIFFSMCILTTLGLLGPNFTTSSISERVESTVKLMHSPFEGHGLGSYWGVLGRELTVHMTFKE